MGHCIYDWQGIHFNHIYAKKTDVARVRLVEMFKACFVSTCTVVGGDLNAAAVALAEESLQLAIKDTGAACR